MEMHEHLLPIQGELLAQGKGPKMGDRNGGKEGRETKGRKGRLGSGAGAGSGKDGALKSRECRAFG